jgi:hypothetical protein
MKKILVALATVATFAAAPVQAHADAGGAFIGGLIIGNILTQPRTVYVQPAPVYVQPAPVYVNPNPYGVQPNPYLYAYPPTRYCHQEDVYSSNGTYLGRQQICN